jgi:hypothetical protein
MPAGGVKCSFFEHAMLFTVVTSATIINLVGGQKNANPAISRINGEWNAPPSNILSGYLPDGPLLGNGDLGITVGAISGDDHEELVLYLGLAQMWGIDTYNHTQVSVCFQGVLSLLFSVSCLFFLCSSFFFLLFGMGC